MTPASTLTGIARKCIRSDAATSGAATNIAAASIVASVVNQAVISAVAAVICSGTPTNVNIRIVIANIVPASITVTITF